MATHTETAPTRAKQVRLPRTAAVWVMAGILWAFFAAAAAPSPLFLVYRAEWNFPVWMLTLAFAIYAIALLGALLSFGRLSDHIGRRPVLLGALLLESIAMTLFLTAGNVGIVILARIVQGIATGAATGALSAAITDFAPPHRKTLAPLLSSVAPLSGLAVGAIFAGLATEGGHPIVVVFIAFDILFLVSLGAVALSPESVTPRPGAGRSLVPRVAIPAAARTEFIREIPVSAAVWIVGGFYLAVVAEVLREVLGVTSGAVEGFYIAGVSGFGALASSFARNLPARVNAGYGSVLIAVGMPVVLLGMNSLVVIAIGTLLAGAGFGMGYLGGVGILAPLAKAHERGELFSGLYVVNYLAFGIPAIIAGLLIDAFGLLPTVNGYGILVVVAGLAGAALQLPRLFRYGHRSTR
ncbi:MFS transporter [Curtobacterium flaccumfaciens]|uniref:MFS transporter n=1 Tax=Curtobacterium flaccumfaciens TaxID=2035 RepID=UPI003F81304C